MTNMARLTATLMEHTDGAIPMVVAIMAEMKLPPKAFQEWMCHTDTDNVPVKAERLKEFMERYRRGLVVTGIDMSSSNKTSRVTESRPQAHSPPSKKPYNKAQVFHAGEYSGCKMCGHDDHFLYQCQDFKALPVAQHQQTQQRLSKTL